MEQLQEGGFAIDSAIESEIVGRAAARGADEGAMQYFYRHPGYEYPTRDEGEFFDREQQVGRLVLSRRMAELAERGFNSIVSTETSFNGVTPALAQVFLRAIDRSRAHRVLQEVPRPVIVSQRPAQAEAEVDIAMA